MPYFSPAYRVPNSSRTKGLTLIEVLIALAIVAVTLAAGMKAAGSLTLSAERLAAVTAAQWCADNQLTALKLARQFPSVGESDFTCQQLGRQYHGTIIIKPTPNPNFRRVDAKIEDEQGWPLYTLTTILPRFY